MPQKKHNKRLSKTKELRKTRQFRLIKGVASLLLRTGPTKLELLKLLTLALEDLDDLNTQSTPWLADEEDLVCSIGDVIQAWHRQRRFMDERARPLALPLTGEKLSVQALIKEFCPDLDVHKILNVMLEAGLIKPSGKGRYAPAPSKLQIYYYGANPLILMNACRTAIRFLDTVNHNVSSRSRDSLYVERVAHVTSLPPDKLRAFLDLTSQQSKLLINTTNDWLESNNEPGMGETRKKNGHVEAGIHIFTFSSKKRT